MKCLILLLACAAAASAYSYVPYHPCPSRFSLKTFWKLPGYSCFSFTVYSCPAWFQANYYANLLKVYPGENCEEMDEDAFRLDCEEKLGEIATEISEAMDEKKEDWLDDLDARVTACIEEYTDNVRDYIADYTEDMTDEDEIAELEQEGEDAIEAYTEKVNDMKADAEERYDDCQADVNQRVVDFHEKIVDAAVAAYQTREEKITEFEENFDDRVECYVERFETLLNKINEKKVELYRCLLERVLGDDADATIDPVITEYETALGDEVTTKSGEYRTQLTGYKDEIVEKYRCAYQIVVYSGCLNFNRAYYSCYCRQLGDWWSFTCDRTISCFKFVNYSYSWSKGRYNCLTTCDTDAVITPVETVETELGDQVTAAVEAATVAFDDWKEDWPTDRDAAVECMGEIIDERHGLLSQAKRASILSRDGEMTDEGEAELSDYEDDLADRKTEALEDYEQCLDDRYDDGFDWFTTALEKYEERIQCIADRILACYTACVEKRTERLDCYSTALDERKAELREKLETRLGEVSDCKIQQFTDLLIFYHGEEDEWSDAVTLLLTTYEGLVVDEEEQVLEDFDCYWDDLIPRLEEHYACSYKCNVNVEFNAPEFCPVNWYIVKPTADCYKYKYSYYCRYYNYSIHCVRGTYTWCA